MGNWLPVIGHIVDLGFTIADNVRNRRAFRKAIKDADERRKQTEIARARMEQIWADIQKARKQ